MSCVAVKIYLTQSPIILFLRIFHIIDTLLCRTYDNISISLNTSLHLPLTKVIHPSLNPTSPTLTHSVTYTIRVNSSNIFGYLTLLHTIPPTSKLRLDNFKQALNDLTIPIIRVTKFFYFKLFSRVPR